MNHESLPLRSFVPETDVIVKWITNLVIVSVACVNFKCFLPCCMIEGCLIDLNATCLVECEQERRLAVP